VKPLNETNCTHHQYPCHTLMYYVSNSTYFFASTTQMLFLPGDHTLKAKVAVQISNVTNFARKALVETASEFMAILNLSVQYHV